MRPLSLLFGLMAAAMADNDHREKRAAGFGAGLVMLTMDTRRSNVADSFDKVNIGDAFELNLAVDLPAISAEDASDLVIEIFALDESDDLENVGFHFCETASLSLGSNVKTTSDVAQLSVERVLIQDEVYVRKLVYTLKDVHTSNNEDTNGNNMVRIQFTAFIYAQGATDQKYWVIGGVEYGIDSEYVYIAKLPLQSDFSTTPTWTGASADLFDFPASMNIGQAYVVPVSIRTQKPISNIEFEAHDAYGYPNWLNLGNVDAQMSPGMVCNDHVSFSNQLITSHLGNTYVHVVARAENVINAFPQDVLEHMDNTIDLSLPISIIHQKDVLAGQQRDLRLVARVDDEIVLDEVHTILLGELKMPPAMSQSLSVIEPPEPLTVMAGDGAVFRVGFEIAPGSTGDLRTELTGVDGVIAEGVRVAHSKFLSGLLPTEESNYTYSSIERDGDVLKVYFGNSYNPSHLPGYLQLELIFATEKDRGAFVPNPQPTAKVGPLQVPLSLTVIARPEPEPEMVVTARQFGFDDELRITGEAGFELLVHMPPGSGANSLLLQSLPNRQAADVDVRMCSMRITEVDPSNLPCVALANSRKPLVTSRLEPEDEFVNSATMDLGRSCPSGPNDLVEGHTFVVSAFFELTPTAELVVEPGAALSFSAGVNVDDDVLWIGSKAYNLFDDDFASPVAVISAIENGETQAQLTAYPPTLFTRERPTQNVLPGEVIPLGFLFRPAPLTRGDYRVQVTLPEGMRLCQLRVLRVGAGMPCLPLDSVEAESIEEADPLATNVVAYSEDNLMCGGKRSAELLMRGLTYWGREQKESMLPDEGSILISVHAQLCTELQGGIQQISHQVFQWPSNGVEQFVEIEVGDEPAPTTEDLRVELIDVSANWTMTLYERATNLVTVRIQIPEGYLGDVHVQLVSNEPMVELCSLAAVDRGENLACFILADDLVIVDDVEENIEINDSILARLSAVCAIGSSNVPEDNMITMEAAVRLWSSSELTTVTLEARVWPGQNTALTASNTFVFTVEEDPSPLITDLDTLETMPTIQSLTLEPPLLSTAEKMWLPFLVELPMDSSLLISADISAEIKDERALLYITGLRFGNITETVVMEEDERYVANVLCSGPDTELEDVYDAIYVNSVPTFMTYDKATLDLGVVVNSGLSRRQKVWNAANVSNAFQLDVEVQLSDHEDTMDAVNIELEVVIRVNDEAFTTSVKEQVVAVRPHVNVTSRMEERGDIVVNATQALPDHTYSETEQIELSIVVKHSELSMAEGLPARLRLLVPEYLVFGASDRFETNYTGAKLSPEPGPEAELVGSFDIFFPLGILYPDIVQINLTLTTDYERSERPIGATRIVFSPICLRSQIDGYPESTEDYSQCGSLYAVPALVSIRDAIEGEVLGDVIKIEHECQVHASSAMDKANHAPFAAISNNSVWAPAVRAGHVFQPWLLFDFTSVVTVTSLSVGTDVGNVKNRGYRAVTTLSVHCGLNHNHLPLIAANEVDLDANGNEIIFDSEINARFCAITIDEAQPGIRAIGVNNVVWKGLKPRGYSVDTSLCIKEQITVDATNGRMYREFGVDDLRDILYFCDTNPRGQKRCFAASNNETGLNTWNELPRYVDHLVGFSALRERFYLGGLKEGSLLSSRDGKIVEIEGNRGLPDDLVAPVAVPGIPRDDLGTVQWHGERLGYRADFDGILLGADRVVQWTSCCNN